MSDLPKLAAPAQRALASIGVNSLEDLTKLSEAELAALHGMGPSTLKVLRKHLRENGLSFRQP